MEDGLSPGEDRAVEGLLGGLGLYGGVDAQEVPELVEGLLGVGGDFFVNEDFDLMRRVVAEEAGEVQAVAADVDEVAALLAGLDEGEAAVAGVEEAVGGVGAFDGVAEDDDEFGVGEGLVEAGDGAGVVEVVGGDFAPTAL